VVHDAEVSIKGTWAYDNKWLLLGLAIVIATTGILAAVAVYSKGKLAPVEPQLLADGWRYDSAISALVGGPGRRAFDGVAAFDARIVDGAVNGVAKEVKATSSFFSRLQNGLIRSYAAIIGIGAVLVLAWFLMRGLL
jgi:NADH-quinone oxidoreductase subunit L